MIDASTIAAAILMLSPALSSDRADHFGEAIAGAAADSIDAAAALVVLGERESHWRKDVERCYASGDGGEGTYQLSPVNWGLAAACGTPERQAKTAARAIWLAAGPDQPRKAFAAYLGATERHREARARAALFVVTWWRIALSECL